MSLFPVRVKQDSANGGTYDYRRKAASLWRDATENSAVLSGVNGSGDFNDMTGLTSVATGGLVNSEWLITHVGSPTSFVTRQLPASHGVIRIGSPLTGAVARGGQLCRTGLAGPITIATSGRVVYECSLDNIFGGNVPSTPSAPNFFVGLYGQAANTDLILSTAGALNTTRGYIGFARTASTGSTLSNLTFCACKDAAGAQLATTVLTAAEVAALYAANTKVNLGFEVINGSKVSIFINGEYYKTASESFNTSHATTAVIPLSTIGLTPAWAAVDMAATTSNVTVSMDVDWYAWSNKG